jgi:hypothetical protein
VPGVLFVCIVSSAKQLDAVDAWYDRDHLPGRMRVPGFLRAIRYRQASGAPAPASACLYELESTEVLCSEPYLAVQAETDDDTACHLRRVELHRLAGDLLDGDGDSVASRPAPMLLATFNRAAPAATAATGGVRRYASEWRGTACTLVLTDMRSVSDDTREPARRDATRSWLLERTAVTTPLV